MDRHFWKGCVGAALLIAAIAAPTPAAAQFVTFRFAAGQEGGVWMALAAALKPIWENNLSTAAIQWMPGDAASNVTAIEDGDADLALGNSMTTADAIEGRAPFKKKHTNVCQLAVLYLHALHVLASPESKIETIADMKGKTVAVPAKGEAGEVVAQQILNANGVGGNLVKTVAATTAEALKLLREGKVDAAMVGDGVPAADITKIASEKDIVVVGVPADKISTLEQSNMGFLTATLQPGTYPKQQNEALAAGFGVQLLAPCNMLDRRAFNLTRVLVESLSQLTSVEKSIEDTDKGLMGADFGTPPHAAVGIVHGT